MIEINLLPEELKRKRRKRQLPKIPLIPTTIIFISALIILQVFLSGVVFFGKKQLSSVEKEWQALAPKKRELDAIKKKISLTAKKTEAIENLMKERLSWSRILNEISNSMTPNVWLTELRYEEKSQAKQGSKGSKEIMAKVRSLVLSGAASGKGEEATAYIAHFITSLKQNDKFFRDFEDIEVVSIKKSIMEGADVMNFTIVCRFES